MKKNYVKPLVETEEMLLETIMADSIIIEGEELTNPDDALGKYDDNGPYGW